MVGGARGYEVVCFAVFAAGPGDDGRILGRNVTGEVRSQHLCRGRATDWAESALLGDVLLRCL